MRRSPLFMKAGKFKSRIWWRCYDWIMKKNPFSHGCCKKFECYRCMLELFFWKNCQLTGNHKFFGSCLEFFNSSVTNQEEDVLKMLSINPFKRKKHIKTHDFIVPALIFDVLVNWLPAHTQFSLPKWRQTSCLAHILPKEQITEHNVSSSYKLQNN